MISWFLKVRKARREKLEAEKKHREFVQRERIRAMGIGRRRVTTFDETDGLAWMQQQNVLASLDSSPAPEPRSHHAKTDSVSNVVFSGNGGGSGGSGHGASSGSGGHSHHVSHDSGHSHSHSFSHHDSGGSMFDSGGSGSFDGGGSYDGGGGW